MKKSGKSIKERRELAGLTQFEVAREVGCDRSKLSEIESGHIEPRPEELATILAIIRAAFHERVERFSRLDAGEAA